MVGFAGLLAVLSGCEAAPENANAALDGATPDYFTADFEVERILDWGDRPVWSPDGERIVFTVDDVNPGPAYEIDLETREVQCLTCEWGASGHVGRIYYLNDSSYLIQGPASLATAEVDRDGNPARTAMSDLYWMPADASLPPQPLHAQAFGEVALDYDHSQPGETRIAWGEAQPEYRLMTGNVINDGTRAFLVNRTVQYADPPGDSEPPVTYVETYDFVDEGDGVIFWSQPEDRAFNGMYKLDLTTGEISALPEDGQHIETHTFPNTRYGLEESNRASDPSSPYRGMSAHVPAGLTFLLNLVGWQNAEQIGEEYGGKTFDLYVHDIENDRRRRLTEVSEGGGQAHQSTPARDGRRIAFSLHGPEEGQFAGEDGLYVGTFVETE